LIVTLACACESTTNKPLPSLDLGIDSGLPAPGDLAGVDLASADAPVLTLDLSTQPGAPTVTIVSPAQTMPLVEVHYDALVVSASVVGQNGVPIDGNSVQLIIAGPGGMPQSAPMSLTSTANVYQGQIDVSSVRSGPASFTVVGSDVMGRQGAAMGGYIHDHGPVITFVQPTKPTARGSLYVEAIIDDALHPLADASTVKATVHAGDHITLQAIAGAVPLRVQGTIDFSTYSPPLDGTQLLTLTATNSSGTMGRGLKQFTVDNVGPSIKFLNPLAGQFIGGILQIKATITDLSGVNDSTVVAVFGGDSTKSVSLTPVGMGEYDGLFDVRQLGTNYVLPLISIRADDQLSNHSELAEEIVVDNVAPMMSLDPPKVFAATLLSANVVQCGQPFDPLGDESANDGQRVQQIFTLHARVEDRGNDAPGLLVHRFSGVDATSVYLYGIPVSNGPLAVDTDGDGKCDDVNPLLQPTSNITASNQAVAVQLAAIPPSGSDDLSPSPSPTPVPSACTFFGSDTALPPLPLCLSGTSLTRAIYYTVGKDPAIWTIPPVVSGQSGIDCTGLQFDSLNRMPEGPACFVVVAKDKSGNHNVSPPLRVCINRGGGMCSAWPPGSLPDCTGTYSKATMMTTATACTPGPLFSPNQVLLQ
jgi:hypothetical protein